MLANPIFVVQLHRARTVHYDFRLEINGILKSWVIPKEPLMDPSVRRLAIMVEDHKLEFARFEGRIPEGKYGAGEIEIWDYGSWDFLAEKASDSSTPELELGRGMLCFILRGTKLTGEWRLEQRTRGSKEWFLVKGVA